MEAMLYFFSCNSDSQTFTVHGELEEKSGRFILDTPSVESIVHI